MNSKERLSDDLARETAVLRRIARGIVFEPALAEDAVQEAWRAAFVVGSEFELDGLTPGRWSISLQELGRTGGARHGSVELEVRADAIVEVDVSAR